MCDANVTYITVWSQTDMPLLNCPAGDFRHSGNPSVRAAPGIAHATVWAEEEGAPYPSRRCFRIFPAAVVGRLSRNSQRPGRL